MAESCKLSATTLALRALINNEELTRKLASLAEESNVAYLYWDALKEWIIEWVEWEWKLIHDYALKKESADIKFKAVLFWWVLANTRQWDEAIDLLMGEIKNTHWTASDALSLIELMAKMDFSWIEDVARVVFDTTPEEASRIIEDIRTKLANYTGTNYSIVTSGSNIKAQEVIDRLTKDIDEATKRLDDAKSVLWEWTYNDVEKDLKRLNSFPGDNKRYWNTKEWRDELKKLADKYWKPYDKKTLTSYLSKISDAKKIVWEETDKIEIMTKEYQDALRGDLKLIGNWQNPFHYVWADSEWKFIKSFHWDVSDRVMQYWQYAMARTLLTDNWTITQSVYDVLKKTLSASKWWLKNYIEEPITEEWLLDESRTLEELMARAYLNTLQLVTDWNIRSLYRQQLTTLASAWNLAREDVEYITSLINTMKFSESWAWFSDVLKYNNLIETAKDLWIDTKKYSWARLWKQIVELFKEEAFDTLITRWNTVVLKDWLELTQRELVELVSTMTSELWLRRAIVSNQRTDADLLTVAAKYITWDKVWWANRLKALIWEAKKVPPTDDIRWTILRAITWKNISEWTDVVFFDFRKWLEASEDVKFRAEYLDSLTDANKINIPNAQIEEVTTTSETQLVRTLEKIKWWYVLVNDSQRKMNSILTNALDIVNEWRSAEDRIRVIYPRGGLMWQIKSVWWKLIFKTSYSSAFSDFLETVALRTFWEWLWDSKFSKELIDKLLKWDLDAIAEVNKTLEENAKKYYWAMLGVDAYSDKLIPMLEEATWISFKNYNSIIDKSDFWKRVDNKFMLEWKILWKYTEEVTTVADAIKKIESLSPEDITSELSQRFWYEISPNTITEGWKLKENIKIAYTNYKLSQTPLELLERKWKLLATINWWTADNITTEQFRSMIQSDDFSAYKEIFFHNTDISDDELRNVVMSINNMIFDNLCAQVADNLIDMGYSLPLANIRELIYDWAKWTLDTNNWFVSAFITKNNLDPTMSTLNGIIYQVMPKELRFAYDEWVKRVATKSGYIHILSEVTNEFMQDTYSSLLAMAAIKDGAKLPNSWHERQMLQDILDEYYNAIKEATKDWKKLTYKQAQELKTRAGYALDMLEQDYLAPQYNRFLTPDERWELFWLKYALWVTTTSQWLDTIKAYNNMIMNRYSDATDRIFKSINSFKSPAIKNSKNIDKELEERQQQLIDQWATAKIVDGQMIIVDIRSEIVKQLRNLPSSILWLEQIKVLWRTWLNSLSNAEAYFLLNVIELARNADNKMNMIMRTIYKVSPQLAKVDFFNTFKAVDGLPKALQWNLLLWTQKLSKYSNTNEFDRFVKEWIFSDIKEAFIKNQEISYKELTKIIKNNIDKNIKLLWNTIKWWELKAFKKESALVYQWAFNLYTILKDVPKEVKESIDEILKEQQKWITAALNMLWDWNRLVDIMDSIAINTADWTVKTFREVLKWEGESLSKILFNEELDIIKWADEAAQKTVNPTWKNSKIKKMEKQNKVLAEKMVNNYRDWLVAHMNQMEVISQAERDLINTTRTSARQIAKQYTLTNKLAETDNALASLNEEIMRDFKSGILWFLWRISQWWQWFKNLWKIWDNISDDVLNRWKEVQNRYRELYNMSEEQLWRFEPKNTVDRIAKNLTLYFKEIEKRLWSLDWMTWWTTSKEVNMAFAHIWEVVSRIDSITSLFSMMSWVEWNQILKFFRFAQPWDLARVDELIIWWVWKWYLWWYRNFVDKTDAWLNRDWFNKTFASNLSDSEYTKLIQALCWFTLTSWKWKKLEDILNFINQSNYLFRVLISYPWQIVTIHPQSIAYFLKQTWRERELWAEDLWTVDAIRQKTGILNTTYNEINIFRNASPDDVSVDSFYNRYWIPDVWDLLDKEKFYTTDDLDTIYSKIDNYWAQNVSDSRFEKFLRNTDAYKDNANNVIDWLFARNFKNIAFLKALQSNNYMKFATAEQFARFMASNAPEIMKTRLMQTIAEASWRNFRNILGLWFSWLDRAVWWHRIKNIFIWLMQMFNFRWAWWQNIARQTADWVMSCLKMARRWLSKEWRDAMALFVAKQPEFTNFTTQLFFDLKNSWKLVKYQDNGDWPVESDDNSIIDFIQYAYETLQFSSQWWQGIQSYWTTRILSEAAKSSIQSHIDPEIYKDTLWIWALLNAMSKNLWRNRKVPNLIAKTLAQNWADARWAYLWNEFWKLSFWTLRYLMNEDETSYGYSTELIKWRPWAIPFVISWEVSEDWDKSFSYDMANTETWLNLTNWRKAKKDWDTDAAREYFMNNMDSFFNASQMLWVIKNAWRMLAWSSLIWDKVKWWLADDLHIYKMWSPFDLAEMWDIVYDTEAWRDFIDKWYYRPTQAPDVEILIKEVIWQSDFRPWNNWFNKSMFNFDKSWHMQSLDKSNTNDASMEMLLTNIKYERDESFNFVLNDKGEKIERPEWRTHMKEMALRSNDANYMTEANYMFIDNWVEENNDDPNYMLYKRLIWEWLAWRYASQAIDSIIDQHNKIHWFKKTGKLTLTELKNEWLYDVVYPSLMSQTTLITGEPMDFLSAIMQLDKAATQRANIKMIERQLKGKWDTEILKKFFNIDKDWNINLWNKYESYLIEQAKLSEALNEWDVHKFNAETASITKMFRDADPYWIMTTVLISSRIKRIADAESLSAEAKAKAIDALLTDNYDFVQTHIPQFIEQLWDKDVAAAYIDQMNKSLYDISYIWDKLVADNEMANSSSWRGAWVRIWNAAKNLIWKLWNFTWWSVWWGAWWSAWRRRSYDYNFVPVRLDWARLLKMTWWKWYTPVVPGTKFQWFKPTLDLSLSKDIKRKVKNTKTQTISNKKQLSNIETKTEKALEAES